jgi:hypothetical protein
MPVLELENQAAVKHTGACPTGAGSTSEDDWEDAEEALSAMGMMEVEAEDEAAPPSAPAPALGDPTLHPTHITKYMFDWRPVHVDANGRQYVCAEMDGGKRWVDTCPPATKRMLTPVAPLPPAADILALSARPSGAYLNKDGMFHAVFLAPQGQRFAIVGGAKVWVPWCNPVRLLVTEHDRAAMGAAVEE